MGTNYYHIEHRDVCSTCMRAGYAHEVETHIGKSSGGWKFILHAPKGGPRSWGAWKKALKYGGVIKSEYSQTISLSEFIDMVESSQSNPQDRPQPAHYDGYFKDGEGYAFSEGEFC